MNQLSKLLLLTGLVTPLLTACSSGDSLKQAELDFDYLEAATPEDLLLPEEVKTPVYSHQYTIPSLGNKAPKAYVGDKVDVRSPALVLPITAGSRVEHGHDSVTLWIDAPEGKEVMQPLLWSVINGYLGSNDVEVKSSSENLGELETEWFTISNDDNTSVFNLKQRYQYRVMFKPHGRTVGLSAHLIGHEVQVVEGGAWHKGISAVDRERYSVQALNKLILYFDTNRAEYRDKVTEAKANSLAGDSELKLEPLVVNKEDRAKVVAGVIEANIKASGDFEGKVPLIILDASFATVGPALRQAILAMGFSVKSVIAIDGYATLKFTPPAPDYLAEFAVSPLPLEAGSYQLLVGDLKTKTSLLFSDKEGRVLPQWQIEALLQHFQPLMDKGKYPKSPEQASQPEEARAIEKDSAIEDRNAVDE